MSITDIPTEVKDFVFQFIDSVEQLEILLLVYASAPREWTPEEISDHLRSNRNSIVKRLSTLVAQRIIHRSESGISYSFKSDDEKLSKTIELLSEIYKIHKYGVLEMIFSPMKKSRDFADAFRITGTKDDKGDKNG